jgi:hypothetical protein
MKYLLVILLSITPFPIFGQQTPEQQAIINERCYTSVEVFATLQQKYKEIPVAMGKINDNTVMTLWSNPIVASWTIVASNIKESISCIVFGGAEFTVVPYKNSSKIL